MSDPIVFGTPAANEVVRPHLEMCPFCGSGALIERNGRAGGVDAMARTATVGGAAAKRLTNAQLTWLEHRAQAALGPEIPVAAQAVTDMVTEIRSLRAELAQRQQAEQRMGDWLERTLNSDAPTEDDAAYWADKRAEDRRAEAVDRALDDLWTM